MTLFDQLINEILATESLTEAHQHWRDVSGRDIQRGETTEALFATLLRRKFGVGVFFKNPKNTPASQFKQADEKLNSGEILWYSASPSDDRKGIDFYVNITGSVKEEEIELLAKELFKDASGLDDIDINSEDFMMFWNDPEYLEQKESFMQEAKSTLENNQEKKIRTFEVKSYKADVKREHGSTWTLIELKKTGGHPGWIYGKEDYIAFRDSRSGRGEPNGFTIISREEMKEYIDSTVDFDNIVYSKSQAAYNLYKRNGPGSEDTVTHVDIEDAKTKGVTVVFWED